MGLPRFFFPLIDRQDLETNHLLSASYQYAPQGDRGSARQSMTNLTSETDATA